MTPARRYVAEALGTAFLLAAVAGSGIMAERLADGDVALALMANSIATGAALVALILAFGSISGAHFNPLVSLTFACNGSLSWRELPGYIGAQLLGAVAGIAATHLMFGEPLFTASQMVRTGPAQWWSEFIASFGLLGVILGCARQRGDAVPLAVGCYIAAAYWFTASTSFANPAVTLARALTDSFSGIRPVDAPAFIGAQLLGAACAVPAFRWLIPSEPQLTTR